MKTRLKPSCRLSLFVGMALAAGCVSPRAAPPATREPPAIHQLDFLKDDLTTREEVLLKLGLPSAQFEGERILTYQFYLDSFQVLHPVAPQIMGNAGLRSWAGNVSSLVLVFNNDGVLKKHNLVSSK
jgi:hypothetical protein